MATPVQQQPIHLKLAFLDFDHTLSNENSDVYAFTTSEKALQVIKTYRRGQNGLMCWTSAVNKAIRTLYEEGQTTEQILAHIATLPMQPNVVPFLTYLKDNGYQVVIVSDANTLFIDAALRQHNASHLVDAIYTNPVHYEGDIPNTQFQVDYMFGSTLWPGAPHTCNSCGPSMC
eukprot:UN03155